MSRGPWLTAAFKAEVWRHWQAGESCAEIGRALYKTGGVIHGVVAERGGVAPVARCRSRSSADVAGARRDLARALRWRVDASDGAVDGPCALEP